MKITLELFGASRDFSNKDFLEFKIDKIIEIKDLRKEIIIYNKIGSCMLYYFCNTFCTSN